MANFREAVNVVKPFILSDMDLTNIRDLLYFNMQRGLQKETCGIATVKMLPSFVTHLPDGHETGTFIGLDLGGTNFRVLLMDMQPGNPMLMDSQIYPIPKEVMTASSDQLFDYLARKIVDFLTRMGLADTKVKAGFTFSFPCELTSIRSATLLQWTKGFKASGAEGQDIVALLQAAIGRVAQVDCEIVAVLNDTVGTLMSCAFTDSLCQIGLIAGTGSNACYMEMQSNISKLESDELNPKGRMCINMDWGTFGDDGCLDKYITKYDELVDQNSINVGKQRYEKMMAGMYLGELVRVILLDLCQKGILFGAEAVSILKTPNFVDTSFVSQVVENKPRHFGGVQTILSMVGIAAVRRDCEIVHMICDAVSRRAAFMCAAGIAAIARKIHSNSPDAYLDITCGVDGSVYKKHPFFARLLRGKTNEMVGFGIRVNFVLSHDGSGKGAALVSAVTGRRLLPEIAF